MDDGSPFPGREVVIFLSAGTIVVTLLLQGTTLEALICKLKVRPDDTQIEEDRLARITAVEAALDYLRHTARDDEGDSAALAQILSEYEYRLAELTAEGETQTHAVCRRRVSREHRLAALKAEREAVDRLWRAHRISDETHRPLQHLLDHEEAMLEGEPGGMQWTEYDIANSILSIGSGAPGWAPSSTGCSVGLEVENFDDAIGHLRGHAVTFHMEPFETPVCRMAFILDPDGNALCIHQRKPGHG